MRNHASPPTGVRLDLGPQDVGHYFCCDDALALCGFDISGKRIVPPVERPDDCPLCVLLLDTPCVVAGCPNDAPATATATGEDRV